MKKIFVILIIFLLITREAQSIFCIETIMGKFSFSESILKYMFKKKFASSCSLAENRDSAKDKIEDRNFYNSSVRDQKMIDAQKKFFSEYNIGLFDAILLQMNPKMLTKQNCSNVFLDLKNKKDLDFDSKNFLKNINSKHMYFDELYDHFILIIKNSKKWKNISDEQKSLLKVIENILFSDKPSLEEIFNHVSSLLSMRNELLIDKYEFMNFISNYMFIKMINECVKKGYQLYSDF